MQVRSFSRCGGVRPRQMWSRSKLLFVHESTSTLPPAVAPALLLSNVATGGAVAAVEATPPALALREAAAEPAAAALALAAAPAAAELPRAWGPAAALAPVSVLLVGAAPAAEEAASAPCLRSAALRPSTSFQLAPPTSSMPALMAVTIWTIASYSCLVKGPAWGLRSHLRGGRRVAGRSWLQAVVGVIRAIQPQRRDLAPAGRLRQEQSQRGGHATSSLPQPGPADLRVHTSGWKGGGMGTLGSCSREGGAGG